jgi:hypothetical protein
MPCCFPILLADCSTHLKVLTAPIPASGKQMFVAHILIWHDRGFAPPMPARLTVFPVIATMLYRRPKRLPWEAVTLP